MISDEMNDVIDFKRLQRWYRRPNGICGKAYFYNYSMQDLDDVYCMKWDCGRCRPIMKWLIFLEILKNVYSFNLYNHFVLTCPGKDFREKFDWVYSYKYMSKAWNKFKRVIEYNYGPFDYIQFARSQRDGYCHYHTIMNKNVPWKFLDTKRHLSKMGYVSIQRNKSLAKYLSVDYWKDNEWCIPSSFKHFRTSQGIIINNFLKNKGKYFTANIRQKDIDFYIKSMFNPDFNMDDYYEKVYVRLNKSKDL